MRVTYAAVMSLDGRITRGSDPNVHAWSSVEDWHHFLELRSQHDTIVIDRTTYETVKPEAEAKWLRIVLTNHPALYKHKVVADQLEFMTSKPKDLVAALKKRGKQRVLLAGGSTTSYEFFKAGLVDDLYITFEPLLFAAGTPMLSAARALNMRLKLESVRELNEQGTLLAHYTLVR